MPGKGMMRDLDGDGADEQHFTCEHRDVGVQDEITKINRQEDNKRVNHYKQTHSFSNGHHVSLLSTTVRVQLHDTLPFRLFSTK